MASPDPKAIAAAYGGEASGNTARIPTPGHSSRDRGTVITVNPNAPGGLLVYSHNGGDPLAIKEDLRDKGFASSHETSRRREQRPNWKLVETYEYDDGEGQTVYRTKRYEDALWKPAAGEKRPKSFKVDRYEDGRWLAGLGDGERVPYRLTELRKAIADAQTIYFVEGERKADKLVQMGFAATCIPFGSKSWRDEYAEHLRGARVCILPDNDDPGRAFASQVFHALEGVSAWPFILELPDLPPAGDVIDWDGSTTDLQELARQALHGDAPEWHSDLFAPGQVDVCTHLKSNLLPYEWIGSIEPVLDGMWLIDDWLPKSGIAALFGHPGSGKTFLALSMAAHVANGQDWAGRAVQQGLVIYLVAEGQRGFKNRVSAMKADGILSKVSPFVSIPVPIDLQDPTGDIEKLIGTIGQIIEESSQQPALLVLDTLSKTFGAGKENTDDMVSYLNNCQRIASEFDCLTLIVHHRPKDSESRDPRGHSSLRGNIDTAILVEGGEVKSATTVKQKDGEDNQRVRFELERFALGENKRGDEISTCLVRLSDVPVSRADLPLIERQKMRLKGHQKTALRAIEVMIAKQGKIAPDEIPKDMIDRWKTSHAIEAGQVADRLEQEFVALVDSNSDKKTDSAKRTVRRVLTSLKSAGILGSWGDWLWLN